MQATNKFNYSHYVDYLLGKVSDPTLTANLRNQYSGEIRISRFSAFAKKFFKEHPFLLSSEGEKRTIDWIKSEASEWNAIALGILGFLHMDGIEVEQDICTAEDCLLRAVDVHDPLAALSLGHLFFTHHKPNQALDEASGVYWHQVMIQQGNALAMNSLGFFYSNKQDNFLARKWFKQGMEAGSVAAKVNFADELFYTPENEREKQEGLELLKSAAEAGDEVAMYNFAGILINQGNTAQGVLYLNRAAEKGLADSMHSLGLCYLNGIGVPTDDEIAFQWFEKAALEGCVKSMKQVIGLCHEKGTQKDLETALYWTEKAAYSGDVKSMVVLGEAFRLGVGTQKNLQTARIWYQKAIGLGDTHSFVPLGKLHLAEEDYKQAAACFQKAADLGEPEAMGSLGALFLEGKGVEKDVEKGIEWAKKAANKDDPTAIFNLGAVYYNGVIKAKNDPEAIKWWQKGAALKDPRSMQALNEKFPFL